jgi:hypothetical protein
MGGIMLGRGDLAPGGIMKIIVVVLTGVLLSAAVSAQSQSIPALFEPVRLSVPSHLSNKPQAVRTQPVVLHWDLLVNAVPGSRFRLNLFKDVEFLASVVRIESERRPVSASSVCCKACRTAILSCR